MTLLCDAALVDICYQKQRRRGISWGPRYLIGGVPASHQAQAH